MYANLLPIPPTIYVTDILQFVDHGGLDISQVVKQSKKMETSGEQLALYTHK